MKIVAVRPGEWARIEEIENTLEAMQAFVGGYIEAVPWDIYGTVLVCNEEGKLLGLPENRRVLLGGVAEEVIRGNFFFCGTEGDEFEELPQEMMWSLCGRLQDKGPEELIAE